MKRLSMMACVFALLLPGCVKHPRGIVDPIEPPSVARLSGVVTYPDGSRVWMARVWIRDLDTVFTDTTGAYALEVPFSSDTMRIDAADGFEPGSFYFQTRWNAARVVPDRDRVIDIVLSQITPF